MYRSSYQKNVYCFYAPKPLAKRKLVCAYFGVHAKFDQRLLGGRKTKRGNRRAQGKRDTRYEKCRRRNVVKGGRQEILKEGVTQVEI